MQILLIFLVAVSKPLSSVPKLNYCSIYSCNKGWQESLPEAHSQKTRNPLAEHTSFEISRESPTPRWGPLLFPSLPSWWSPPLPIVSELLRDLGLDLGCFWSWLDPTSALGARRRYRLVWGWPMVLVILYLLPGGWSQESVNYHDKLRACPSTSWAKKIHCSGPRTSSECLFGVMGMP